MWSGGDDGDGCFESGCVVVMVCSDCGDGDIGGVYSGYGL